MKLLLKFVVAFGVGLLLSPLGQANEKLQSAEIDPIENSVRTEIGRRYPNATIEFLAGSTFPVEREGATPKQVRILSENGGGTADYTVTYSDGSSALGQARFSAMVPTLVATRRIRPGERLSRDDFSLQPINVAQGLAYQYRGVMLGAKEAVEGLQARQTILEGQYPLSSGVEKVPDIRRGDTVQVKILSGEIQLLTQGLVQEPGYMNQSVRVLTQKTKKELTGHLREGGIVEVKL